MKFSLTNSSVGEGQMYRHLIALMPRYVNGLDFPLEVAQIVSVLFVLS